MTISITDHAVIRYLERVVGLDVEGIRGLMRDDMGPSGCIADAPPRYTVRTASACYVIVKGHVVTVTPPKSTTGYYPVDQQPGAAG